MKKCKCIVLLCALVISLPLCAQETEEAPAPVVVTDASSVETQPLSKQAKEEAKKAEKEKKKAARADKKRRKNERTDKYLGIVYLPETNYDLKAGQVQISLRGGTGSFNVYARKEKGFAQPVLSTADDSSTSYFSVLVNENEYRLNHDAGAIPEVRKLEESCQLAYTLEKKVQVVLDFKPFSSTLAESEEEPVNADMVRIMVYVSSLSSKKQTVAVKALFDTILGENTDYHFYTGSGLKVAGGKQFSLEDMEREKWIISTNGKNSVQFLLKGRTISDIEAVSIANRDDLSRSRWIPFVAEAKGFNGVLAYNNSALAVSWPQFVLEPEKTEMLTMYMVLGTDGEEPQGEAFLNAAPVEIEPVQEEDSKTGFVVKNPSVEFIVPPITDEQLDPAYIQALIDRINNLQSDPNLVDRTEVRRLNAELDAILEKIRQQR